MQLSKIPLAETKAFTPFFLDYIQQKDSLKPFYNRYPDRALFRDQLTEKEASFPSHHREILVSVLQRQYHQESVSEEVNKNLARLKDTKTFTITTGHQLNIFTGPLYFIYKIVTVINACRELKKTYPDYHFVPVYWMASEDHDIDEIKYFRLYGKKYTWQTSQTGAVGRFAPNGIEKILQELPGQTDIFRNAYAKRKTLSDAVRTYVHELFKTYGMIVIDPDDRELKSLFKPVMREDLIQQSTLPRVVAINQALEKLNYKPQVFCRDINFFYLDGNIRNRIEKKEDRYVVADTALSFTRKELEAQIENSPEKFSPNVILRPLYQEIILPNLAYVGGPAEMVYWLQLKKVFEFHSVPFPILLPRNFALVVEPHLHRKFSKTGLDYPALFEEKNYLFNHWVLKNSRHDLTVGSERDALSTVYSVLKERANTIDKTLGPFVGAEGKKMLNSLEKIERKLLRAEKRLHADRIRQIETVKDALFPNGNLQERTDNFLNFYLQDTDFITKLIHYFDPFDFRFNILTGKGDDQTGDS